MSIKRCTLPTVIWSSRFSRLVLSTLSACPLLSQHVLFTHLVSTPVPPCPLSLFSFNHFCFISLHPLALLSPPLFSPSPLPAIKHLCQSERALLCSKTPLGWTGLPEADVMLLILDQTAFYFCCSHCLCWCHAVIYSTLRGRLQWSLWYWHAP